MKCGTCRFWGLDGPDSLDSVQGEHRVCGRIFHDADGAIAWDEKDRDWLTRSQQEERARLAEPMRRQLAVLQDGSGYRADLYSKADFFCALYEETA